MEKIKYSILVCPYSNAEQFKNFLYTACMQDYQGKYEVVVVDNVSPTTEIKHACSRSSDIVKYYRIKEEDKKCTNITQGINLAADISTGEYIVIIPDPNVLLSFNLLSEIDKVCLKRWKIIISGLSTDIKISQNATLAEEYEKKGENEMAKINSALLLEMGWPNDPMKLKLIDGKHRHPPAHRGFEVYMVAMHETHFSEGPYNENLTAWGPYHEDFVKAKCRRYAPERLKNIRLIHQLHRVWKSDRAITT